MEPQLIYIKSQTLIRKIKWAKVTPDSEWLHFNIDGDFKKELVVDVMYNHLKTKSIYNIIGRKDSILISLDDFEKNIEKFIQSKYCLIWDGNFEEVIEFDAIGVMRCGGLSANMPNNTSPSFFEGQQLLKSVAGDLSDIIIEERRSDL